MWEKARKCGLYKVIFVCLRHCECPFLRRVSGGDGCVCDCEENEGNDVEFAKQKKNDKERGGSVKAQHNINDGL